MKRADEQRARLLLERMGREAVPLLSEEQEAELQLLATKRVIEALRAAGSYHESPVRRRWRWVLLAAAATIPLVALASARLLWPERQAVARTAPQLTFASGTVLASDTQFTPARSRPLERGSAVAIGEGVQTAAASRATLELVDGAMVDLAERSAVRIMDSGAQHEQLALAAGSVFFQVPKLEHGHTLSVRTPDAVVTVRGTRFSVAIEQAGAQVSTSVDVSEGRVQIDAAGRSFLLTAGQHWSSASKALPPAPSVAPAPAVPAATLPPRSSAAIAPSARKPAKAVSASNPAVEASATSNSTLTERAPSSSLADENALYARALRRANGGEYAGALADLDTLIREHPASPLLQSARVERFRALLRSGARAAAVREARRYLSDYPDGFARSEAKQIALQDGSSN